MRTLHVPLLALLALLPSDSQVPIAVRVPAVRVEVPTEASLFYQPTPAAPLSRIIGEWEPASALVVALPGGQVLGNAGKERFFRRLIRLAANYVNVVILVNEDDRMAIIEVMRLLAGDESNARAASSRVTFVRGLVDTEWIRDYGPLFGEGLDGQPVLIDSMYRDLRKEADTERTLANSGVIPMDAPHGGGEIPVTDPESGRPIYLSDYGHFWRRYDDAAPVYFNEILYLERRRLPLLVRPPLLLSGGDVTFASDGRMITSTKTLEANGGNEARFRQLAKAYFNAGDVVYLRPLPNTVSHIDMFLKVAGPGMMMLGDYHVSADAGDTYLGMLEREMSAVLEWNRALIAERFPDVEIVSVPMPPLRSPHHGRSSDTAPTGVPKLDTAIAAHDLRVKPLSTVLVRSFLNSVVLNGIDGRSAVFVPTFAGLEGMEDDVRRAYRRAFRAADVHFINADTLADEFGGIHCVTITTPDWNGVAQARNRK